MSAHVLIMAAGTGGHIFPGLAVAQELRNQGATVTWLGTAHGLENALVPKADIPLKKISIRGVRGKGWMGWLALPFQMLKAMWEVWGILRSTRPQVCLSMGGYIAGPGGVVAKLMGLPLVIHEQNAIAGLTNRALAPLAKRIFTGFPEVLKRGEHVGNPVRADISALPHPQLRWTERSGPIRILVIGGSQGARIFAQRLPKALAALGQRQDHPAPQLIITHQAGRVLSEAKQAYAEVTLPPSIEVRLVEFIDDMAQAWGEADVAITRAGALTVAELAAAGVGALLVPFALAVDDHQSANARFLSEAGAAWQLSEQELSTERLTEWLSQLDRAELLQRAERARQLAKDGAAVEVAHAVLELAA